MKALIQLALIATIVVVIVAGYTEEMQNFLDTNPGLASRFPERDFARFARGSGDVRTGSGLGLSICETAMHRMGGTFRLDRSEDGCRFMMTFPKALPQGEAL